MSNILLTNSFIKLFKVGCTTISGPKPNVACVFPFIYKGNTYDQCTSVDHTQRWCATKVNNDGTYVGDDWGDCGSDCPGITIYFCRIYRQGAYIVGWLLHCTE